MKCLKAKINSFLDTFLCPTLPQFKPILAVVYYITSPQAEARLLVKLFVKVNVSCSQSQNVYLVCLDKS